MFKPFAALTLTLLVAAVPAHAETLKALSFQGVVSTGGDWSGGVFGDTPAYLTGKAVSGRFVFDLDKMPGAVAFAATYADYVDPLFPVGATYDGSSTGPFMRAFITIDGRTHEIENKAQPSIAAPVFQRVMVDDHPEYAPWDAVNAKVISYRPQICACTTAEFLDLYVAALPGGFLSGESFGQNFDVAVQPGNANSYVQFQILSGFQYGVIYVPSTPAWGVESYHYASGTITLTQLSLQDVSAVPEPGAWALMTSGLAGLIGWRRRRQA